MFTEYKGKFYIKIQDSFESAHYLYKYFPDGSDEPVHGHSWKVEIFLESKSNIKPDGISYDFLSAKKKLSELIDSIDHVLINEHPDFTNVNPTSENVARWFYHHLKDEVSNTGGIIQKIVVHEGPQNLAYFEPE